MSRNYINDGLQTFAIIDGIYQRRADREQAAADRERLHARQDEQDAWRREDRERQQAIRTNQANLFREEANAKNIAQIRQVQQELSQIIGPDAADYADPIKRDTDRPLLDEGLGRVKSGNMDEQFYLNYFNTIYPRQINRGTGGVKKSLVRVGASPDGQGIVAGLEVTDEQGKTRREMMTRNRGTREEGDNEVKTIRIADLIRDNIQRQIIVDAFDRHGIGLCANLDEERQRSAAAITEIKAKLLELGDTSIAERDQVEAREARQRQQNLEDNNLAHRRALEIAEVGQEYAMDRLEAGHRNALELADVNNEAAAGRTRITAAASNGSGGNGYTKEAVKKSLASYYRMRQNWVSAKAGGVITYVDAFGQERTKKASYKDIAFLERAMEAEMRFLQSAGVFARSEAPGQQPPPSQPGAAGGQQAGTQPQQGGQQPPGVPDGTVLGKPIQKNGQMVYPVLDGKTGRPVINPQTGKPMGYIPNRS